MTLLQSGVTKSAAADAYTIDNSLRFDDGDSAYLSRVQGDGNRKIWTASFWFKRGNLGIYLDVSRLLELFLGMLLDFQLQI